MSALAVDIQELVDPPPFGRFRTTVLTSCFPIGAADGFDTTAVGFIAPALKLPPARSAP
jgi:MFS transporter, AAHS family, 4-hydroxybenzoate transporter